MAIDTREDPGEFYNGGTIVPKPGRIAAPVESVNGRSGDVVLDATAVGAVAANALEGETMQTNTIPNLREAVRKLGEALGARVICLAMIMCACAANGAGLTLETVPANNIDFDANPPIVTNAILDTTGLATAGELAAAAGAATNYTDSAIAFEAGAATNYTDSAAQAATNYTDSTAATLRDSIAGKADATNIYTKAETDAKIVELAPAPGNYAAVSNAAVYAAITNALQDAAIEQKTDKRYGTLWSPTISCEGFGEIMFTESAYDPVMIFGDKRVRFPIREGRLATSGDFDVLMGSLAPEFDRNHGTYNKNDLIRGNSLLLFRCTNSYTTTPQSPYPYDDPTHWATTTVEDVLAALRTGKQDNLPYPTNAIPYAAISGTPNLATVATSGSYNDLSNKPQINGVSLSGNKSGADLGVLDLSGGIMTGELNFGYISLSYDAINHRLVITDSWNENYAYIEVPTGADNSRFSTMKDISAAALAATNYTDSTAADLRVSIAGKASTNDVTLTDASTWTFEPATYNGYPIEMHEVEKYPSTSPGVYFFMPYANGGEIGMAYYDTTRYATSLRLQWHGPYGANPSSAIQLTATRTALQGYQLGSQSDKPLASEAEAEALRTGKQDKLPYPTNAIPYAAISGTPNLATVATTGSYNDLSDKPDIPVVPTNVSAFNNDAGYLTSYTETDPTVPAWAKAANKPTYTYAEITSKPTFATVATSGSYNDLTDKPTIPSPTAPVASATLAWQSNGSAIVVSVGAAGTLSATLTGWIEGQTQTALITIAAGASISAEVKLVGYGTWPTGGQFIASATRVGNFVYVTPIVLVN